MEANSQVNSIFPKQRLEKSLPTNFMRHLFRQFPYEYSNGYGSSWFEDLSDNFGHPGAYSIDMHIGHKIGPVTTWLVQYETFPSDGGRSRNTFERTSAKRFGPAIIQ